MHLECGGDARVEGGSANDSEEDKILTPVSMNLYHSGHC